MPRNTLHHEGKLAHAIFPSSPSTSALVKTTLDLEKNLTHASFPSTMKATQHMLAHLIAHAHVHCQKQHYTMNDI